MRQTRHVGCSYTARRIEARRGHGKEKHGQHPPTASDLDVQTKPVADRSGLAR